ncbi:MAG: hypothetical protein M1401_09855 [Chloroflexi bacterium]|nr:hypothetical protein [Chloroflexota bacterium]MCL5109150.1 hypothetical protein [Chloroflexota bacterium]
MEYPARSPTPDRLRLIAAWEVWRTPDRSSFEPNYCLAQHLQDSAGQDLAIADITLERMEFLREGDVMLSWSELPAASDLQCQQAWLSLGMFHCWRRDAAQLLDARGQPASGDLRLGPFAAGVAPDLAPPLSAGSSVGLTLGGEVELLGYDLAKA